MEGGVDPGFCRRVSHHEPFKRLAQFVKFAARGIPTDIPDQALTKYGPKRVHSLRGSCLNVHCTVLSVEEGGLVLR